MTATSEAADQGKDLPVNIGGQAVIEGVMMRAPGCVATAIRLAPDRILVRRDAFLSYTKRKRFLGLPVIRGAVSLVESLVIGTRTLNWSAEVAQRGEEVLPENTLSHRLFTALSLLGAFAAGLLLFMYIPYLLSSLVDGSDTNQVYFHLVVGLIRIALLLLYLWGISRWEDVRRLFEYHGAEHKSIFAYEETGEVCVRRAAEYQRFHPRCGTSFLLVVAIATVLVYAVFDTAWVFSFGNFDSVLERLFVHLPIIPLVAGFAFEALLLSNRFRDTSFARLLILPGLWFQRLTTREPNEQELEVAVVAIRASLDIPMDGIESGVEFL